MATHSVRQRSVGLKEFSAGIPLCHHFSLAAISPPDFCPLFGGLLRARNPLATKISQLPRIRLKTFSIRRVALAIKGRE